MIDSVIDMCNIIKIETKLVSQIIILLANYNYINDYNVNQFRYFKNNCQIFDEIIFSTFSQIPTIL